MSLRELKWEIENIAGDEWLYEWKEEQVWLLYESIINEFKFAQLYYNNKLNNLLYKHYDYRIDYKLLYVLNLPQDIQQNICKYIFILCKQDIYK